MLTTGVPYNHCFGSLDKCIFELRRCKTDLQTIQFQILFLPRSISNFHGPYVDLQLQKKDVQHLSVQSFWYRDTAPLPGMRMRRLLVDLLFPDGLELLASSMLEAWPGLVGADGTSGEPWTVSTARLSWSDDTRRLFGAPGVCGKPPV